MNIFYFCYICLQQFCSPKTSTMNKWYYFIIQHRNFCFVGEYFFYCCCENRFVISSIQFSWEQKSGANNTCLFKWDNKMNEWSNFVIIKEFLLTCRLQYSLCFFLLVFCLTQSLIFTLEHKKRAGKKCTGKIITPMIKTLVTTTSVIVVIENLLIVADMCAYIISNYF